MEQVRAHGLLAGAAAWSRAAITRRRKVIEHANPSALDVRPVSFHSQSGANIRAWLLAGNPGSGAVLLLHGMGADRRSMVARARFLHTLGYTYCFRIFRRRVRAKERESRSELSRAWMSKPPLHYSASAAGASEWG